MKDIFEKCAQFQDARQVQAAGLYPYFRAIESTTGNTVVSDGKKRVMIGSNNYLGLTHHPRVIEAAQRAVEVYGSGCTGSRFLNGNLDLHEQLEVELAKFLKKEACLVFSTGFFANLGTLGSLVGRKDVIYSDRDNHASIVEGTRAALGETIRYKHNDMEDLERVLQNTREKYEGAIIVTDGVFSMSGAIVKLPEMVALAKKYNCRVYCDDAHALGVLGEQGRGTANHFGLDAEVDLIMGTFSKSFASIGGYIAGPEEVIHYIKHKARPFIFSAAMPPSAAATVLECLHIAQEEPQHLANLWQNTFKIRDAFTSMGLNNLGSITPIQPVHVGDDMAAFAFTKQLYENGIFATPVISPAVPQGQALIRTSYLASHQDEDLDYVIDTFEKLGHQFGLIKSNAGLALGSTLGVSQDVASTLFKKA